MKKSLVILSFIFIFLLSMSIVSAGFFDWITGNAGLSCGVCPSGTLCDRSVGVCFPASTTSTSDGRTKTTRTSTTSSDNLRTSQSSDVTKAPRGWTEVDDAYGGKCYVKEAKSIIKQTRTGGVIRWWGNGQVVINDNGDIVLTQN